ncbi:coiled-coil domain-containing protein 185 [Rhinoderma darwinii]|uniref:coiled-coil domain-containing protein 185 n=1 Tax=Rhinoderma darwinii TaxID=43563 RepID=UPI003F672B92
MEDGRRSPSLHLDLTNFEDDGDSRYVLTSPRSLEACARLAVRPVDLLYKSYGDVRNENPGVSSQEVSDIYETYELERLRKVRLCRDLRKKLLDSDCDPGRPRSTSSNLQQDHSRTYTTSKKTRDVATYHWEPRDAPSSHRDAPSSHRDAPSSHRDATTSQRDATTSQRDATTSQRDATTSQREPAISSNHWDYLDVTTSPNCWDPRKTTASPIRWDPHKTAASPTRWGAHKTAALPTRWDPHNTATSPTRWDPHNTAASPNCLGSHCITTKGHRGEGEMLRRSLSQGTLIDPEVQIHHLARQVEKEIKVSVPERDKKIAALMLLKHQEEEMSKQRKLQAQQAWEDLRSKEKVIREALSKHDWTDRVQNQRQSPRTSKLEWQLDAIRYLTVQNNKEWKTLTPEQRVLLKDGMKKVQKDLQSKKQFQERMLEEKDGLDKNTREMGGRLLEERMLQAIKAKMIKDLQNKKNIQTKNEYEKRRHSRLKEEVDNLVKAEEYSKRKSMQQKERRSQEMYEQVQEERNKEIQEKASREEGMIVMAKIRAEQQEKEQRKHKKMLVQVTNQKLLQAEDSLGKSKQSKAERMRELNFVKEKAHQLLKQKLEEEEESYRKHIGHLIRIKDRKSDQVLKEKEATIEEGKKIARASFHIRDKIREQTKSRTFDQMALQAQLSASLLKTIP